MALLDLNAARRAFREMDRNRAGAKEALESKIFAHTLSTVPEDIATKDPEALEAYFQRTLKKDFQSRWTEAGQWGGFGQIELTGLSSKTNLQIDEKNFGQGFTRWVVRHVPPGLHRVRMAEGEHQVVHEVEVKAGRRVQIGWSGPSEVHPAHTALWISGAALAAAGVALTVVAGVNAQDGVQVTCLRRGSETCSGLGTPTFSDNLDRLPSTDPGAVSSGVPIAPLGVALTLTGASWAIGSRFEDSDGIPWWSLAAGLVLGGLGYGVGTALGAQ